MVEFKRMVEETKKEVRDIRALERQMKWNLQREEHKEVVLDKKAEEEEIRDWRWKQTEGMKAHAEEKAQEDRAVTLEESKAFQEFKRERKVETKDEDLRYIQEVYHQDLDHAEHRVEMAREQAEREQTVISDRLESRMHLKEQKLQELQLARARTDEQRMMEQTLEMQAVAEQLAREKAALLQSLELTKAATRVPIRSGGTGRSSAVARGRP